MAESRHDDQQDEQSENQASKDIEGAANQPNMHNKRLGRLGEDVAARYLVSRGYEIIARNWTCQAGEADIIARDDDILVFAEVKTRSSTEKGFPSEAVDSKSVGSISRLPSSSQVDTMLKTCRFVSMSCRWSSLTTRTPLFVITSTPSGPSRYERVVRGACRNVARRAGGSR